MNNLNPIYKSEDSRRTLIEWVDDANFKSAKVLIANSDQAVGDHYHNNKDEIFLLLSGKAKKVIIGNSIEENVLPIKRWIAPRGTYHLFELEKGSILLGVGSEKFDPKDELKQ